MVHTCEAEVRSGSAAQEGQVCCGRKKNKKNAFFCCVALYVQKQTTAERKKRGNEGRHRERREKNKQCNAHENNTRIMRSPIT